MTEEGKAKLRTRWTPERRKQQAKIMAARHVEMKKRGIVMGPRPVSSKPRLLKPDGTIIALKMVAPNLFIVIKK